MIAPTAIIAGLGMSLEMDIVEVEGATGDYHTNLINKAGFINIFFLSVYR
jgi:2,3-bisphosphoglycerate-independent phosphoglycerate mutase